jgi:hypothetical protein
MDNTEARDEDHKKNHNVICVGHHYTQANTNNVNKTRALLQSTAGIDNRQRFLVLFYLMFNVDCRE